MAQRAALLGDRGEVAFQLCLLDAEEAHLASEEPGVTAITDDHLELTLFITTDP